MGNKKPHQVQQEFVINIEQQAPTNQQNENTGDLVFDLVDINKFTQLFKDFYPESSEDPIVIWHNLLGNDPSGVETGFNKEARYLTSDSCKKILKYYPLFQSGVDFNNLPLGFFLTKNPGMGGLRDVLHYSECSIKNTAKSNPLAVILSEKKRAAFEPHEFKPPQSKWYEFLRSKMITDKTIFCSEQELKKAFITFSNTVTRLKLDFLDFKEPYDALKNDFNPIVLLGRWNAILTQPHLKEEDYSRQLKALPYLELTSGYGPLRAISDVRGTKNPCGFITPEMFSSQKYHEICNIYDPKIIQSMADFWIYIAHQPLRNSINYYEKGLEEIDLIDLNKDLKKKLNQEQKRKMQVMLAASTTGYSHFSKVVEEETLELGYWKKICSLIDNFGEHGLVNVPLKMSGKLEDLKNGFIRRLEEPVHLPNVPFLHSMAVYIEDFIRNFSIITGTKNVAKGLNPLHHLTQLSDKLNKLIAYYKSDFYEGARFYFVNGVWVELGAEKYFNLQDHMHENMHPLKGMFAPYFSTFKLLNEKDINEIHTLINQPNLSPTNISSSELAFCLSLFKDAVKPCSKKDLLKIIEDIYHKPKPYGSLISILEYVESNFTQAFPQNYFLKKKQELLDAQFGLNKIQIETIKKLNFSEEQSENLIHIESALVRRNPTITNEQLDQLNECLVSLSRVITPTDFSFLLEKLELIREHLPKNIAILNDLITTLSKKRSVYDFTQIFYRNQIENCNDETLINKFILFINSIKSMAKPLGTIDTSTVEELLGTLTLNSSRDSLEKIHFTTDIQYLLDSIEKIITVHPHLKLHLLNTMKNIPEKRTLKYLDHAIEFLDCVNQISHILPAGKDEESQHNMLTIYSLLANNAKEPIKLTQLFNSIKKLKPVHRKFILALVNKLKENDQDISGLDNLIHKINTIPSVYDLLFKECSQPPYPNIPTLNTWLDKGNLKEEYQKFSMLPYGKRRLDFAFQRTEFDEKKNLFGEVAKDIFSEKLAKNLENLLEANRKASIEELRDQFSKIKLNALPLTEELKLNLLCICTEMLARTTAQLDDSSPPKLISQELNTTQIMALYAMLTNSNSKLISEIGTGEGKSRINMILAACQAAQGKTVDFLTSDMSLAERDFLSYKAFFTSLGIRTSLISLNTPKQLYQKGGINFTDNGQLILLRNQSDINQDPYAFLEQDPTKRCVIIDEVDKFKHDKAKDSFNYAAPSQALKSFTWIYPLLVDFVSEKIKENPDALFDAKYLTKDFVNYVGIHDTDELHQANVFSLNEHHQIQLTTWLNSAYTALHMKEDEDFIITADVDNKLIPVKDAGGFTRYSRQIMVLDNGRPVEGASFSLGVQQCLCAIQNQKAKKQSFIILPENETQRASYPVSFLSKYEDGLIYGSSGTSRYKAPSKNKIINYENYSYLVVPRHKKVRRKDRNIWLAKDEQQQIKFLKKIIQEKLKKTPKEPILIICKNDKQSKIFHEIISEDKALKYEACNLVHGLTTKDEELKAIKEAGLDGHITISTVGMFGRGVDINANNLFVAATYVPTFEDEEQIKGRTGRAGKDGEYRMIPNMNDPDCVINGKTYNVENEIDKIQRKMAVESVKEEEIAKLYAGFLEHTHQNFLKSFGKVSNVKEELKLAQNWQKYLSDLQKDWDIKRSSILDFIETSKEKEFIEKFTDFTQFWEKEATFIHQEDKKTYSPEKAKTIYSALKEHQTFFKETRKPIRVQSEYDVSDDGQARIYSSLFVQLRAVLQGKRAVFADFYAWREGRGELFPDLMATLRGERPLFANLRAFIARLIAELKDQLKKKPKEEEKKSKAADQAPAVPNTEKVIEVNPDASHALKT